MSTHKVMVLSVQKRSSKAPELQEMLTSYGCHIKARIGLHEAENECSESGLILLQLTPRCEQTGEMLHQLNDIDGVNAKLVEMPF